MAFTYTTVGFISIVLIIQQSSLTAAQYPTVRICDSDECLIFLGQQGVFYKPIDVIPPNSITSMASNIPSIHIPSTIAYSELSLSGNIFSFTP